MTAGARDLVAADLLLTKEPPYGRDAVAELIGFCAGPPTPWRCWRCSCSVGEEPRDNEEGRGPDGAGGRDDPATPRHQDGEEQEDDE
jgi:hypothetical protein